MNVKIFFFNFVKSSNAIKSKMHRKSKLGTSHTMEYYTVMKMNIKILHWTIWMNLTNMMKEARPKRVYTMWVHALSSPIENQTKLIYSIRSQVNGYWGLQWLKEKAGSLFYMGVFSFWKLIELMIYILLFLQYFNKIFKNRSSSKM